MTNTTNAIEAIVKDVIGEIAERINDARVKLMNGTLLDGNMREIELDVYRLCDSLNSLQEESKEHPLHAEIAAERKRQDEKWGGAEHDDEHTVAEWVQIIEDYAGWARQMAGMASFDKARRRLVQIAALAVAAVESIDRTDPWITQKNPPPPAPVKEPELDEFEKWLLEPHRCGNDFVKTEAVLEKYREIKQQGAH